MNLYGYTGFDHDKALKDWELAFGINKGYSDDKMGYQIEVLVATDKREYKPVEKKDGTTFTPLSNDLAKFTVVSDEEPADLQKMQPIKLIEPYDSYMMGAKTYNPSVTIICERIEAL